MPNQRLFAFLAAFALTVGAAHVAAARGRHSPHHPPETPAAASERSCGVGTLAFERAVQIAAPAHPPRSASVFVNLLDGDANVDVGVARGHKLFSALGDGSGRFDLLSPISVGHPARLVDVASGDFDGDGINDAVLTDALKRRSVLTVDGTPSGRLAGRRRAIFLGGHRGPHAAVAGDWNGDARSDVATGDKLSRSVTVLTREDDGSWTREQVRLPFRPVDLLAADVDGNTTLDLLAASARGNVMILANDDGHFGGATRPVIMHGASWSAPGASIEAADLNRDGATDLLSLRADGRLAVRLAASPGFASGEGDRGAVFEEAIVTRLDCGRGASRPKPGWGWLPTWFWDWHAGPSCRFAGIAVGDIDLDGTADLVATSPKASRDVRVLFGEGNGRFEPGFALRTRRGLAADLRLADVNGDGRLDPVVGAQDGAAFALPSRCDCRPPFEGPTCEACSGPRCPIGGNVLAMQLTVGPREIVRLGAELVGASLQRPTDLQRAATTAQRLAALTLESDAVVVAMPLRDRNELVETRGSSIPTTVTTFEVQEVLKGAVRGLVEISQEGGSLASGERQDSSNQIPFPSVDDLALCPDAAGASAAAATSPHWLLFLRAGAALFSLVGDLTEPALQVEASNGSFVLYERASGLVLPVGELAGLPDRRRAP